jgi:hypothetical protein
LLIVRHVKIGLAAWAVMACSAAPAVQPTPSDPLRADSAYTNEREDRDATLPHSEPVRPFPVPITIVAVGDIMPGSVSPIPFAPTPTDHDIPEAIRRIIPEADVVFGNLEGTFMVDGLAPAKCRPESREAGRCYEFGFPPFLVSFLLSAGFTVLSLDNNHSDDYGLPGYVFTQGLLAQAGLVAVPKRIPTVLSVRDVAVSIVPFGFSGRSFHISDLETARSIVADASRNADIVIVSFHGGAEGETASRVVDIAEEYHGEDRGNVLQFAHAVVEAGADMVLGHGPHVPRAVELYRGRLIAYSLGNFWTYGNISIKGTKGVMPLLRATVARDGTFLSGQLISMRQRLPGIPEPDPENTAIRLIATLSREDFPSSPLTITEAGDVQVRSAEGQDERQSELCDANVSSGCTEAGLLRRD